MKSVENIRLKKAEETRRNLNQKLKEQEIKYNQIIDSLQSKLDSLMQKNEKEAFISFGKFKKSRSITDVANQTGSKHNNIQGIVTFLNNSGIKILPSFLTGTPLVLKKEVFPRFPVGEGLHFHC